MECIIHQQVGETPRHSRPAILKGMTVRPLSTRIVSPLTFALAALIPCTSQAQTASPPAGLASISGKQLLRDGKPWIPHGFYQVPFEVPPGNFAAQNAVGHAFWQDAYAGFTPAEYATMKSEGADSVRLQIAQDGADPENTKFFDPQWLQQAIGAVQAARKEGLTVIVSIQDETQTGSPAEAPLPNDATRRVWRELVPAFGHDRGILLELYNEPNDSPISQAPNPDQVPTAEQWDRWATAMNQTIAEVRALGADNVLVADGLVQAQQLTGAPELTDPLHQVLYASHPYVSGATQAIADYNQTAAAWNDKFGNFARTHPVIISEWGDGFFCDTQTPQAVLNFLNYLNERGIGLEAGLWDFTPGGFNNLTHGFPDVQFSSFFDAKGSTCTLNNAPAFYGPGKTVEAYFLTGVPPASPL